MIYRFGACQLDTLKRELRRDGAPIAVEPQVFALLLLLIEARDRLVSRDDLIEQIWGGRIISEAAISSRIKSARQAVGDDGEAQRIIRTLPKLGFRFVADVEVFGAAVAVAAAAEAAAPLIPEPTGQPIIAVLPFDVFGDVGPAALLSQALPHDLIAQLSRLRWLKVIARGSSFRFKGPNVDLAEVRSALMAKYVLKGSIEVHGRTVTVTAELSDTTDRSVIWADTFTVHTDEPHEARQSIAQAVVAALDLRIPLHEAQTAALKSPQNLDAWSAYHLGLVQLFRFSAEGNPNAAALFEKAAALEPSFARAYAGLSFTHFENAFLRFAADREHAIGEAQRFAEKALTADPLDPFSNLVMGRSLWLRGELEGSLAWIDRAIDLNPNYAQAKYSRAWTETLMGHAEAGQARVASALELSPLDPLAYGMHGVRAMSHVILGEPQAAAIWGERAARTPGAHALIEVIAAVCHSLNGASDRAETWLHHARQRAPQLSSETFFEAFPLPQNPVRRRIESALDTLGL